MLGVNYESSDDEDAPPATVAKLANPPAVNAPAPAPVPAPAPEITAPPRVAQSPSLPINGPVKGPTVSPPPLDNDVADGAPPGSPYTSSRAAIQNLTLPTVPNFAIPPSPPGSPPQRATKKFAQFLELKKKGQHFNQRLESSSVLRDPGHSQKLMKFAGISEEQQYASTLPEGLAVPTVFVPWAYAEELRASQKKQLKANEQARSNTPREFVPATKTITTSRTSTPGKRKELEHRGRDASPKRKR